MEIFVPVQGQEIYRFWCYFECIPTPGRLKNLAGHGGNRTYELCNTSPVIGSIPTVASQIFQLLCNRDLVILTTGVLISR